MRLKVRRMAEHEPRRAVETVWKMESARIVAGVARMLRGDVGLAEEAAQEALVAALEQWPGEGVPENPGAWLMTTAKRRAVDAVRRGRASRAALADLAREVEPQTVGGEAASDRVLDGEVNDDVLRLIFTACHPALPGESQSALTLRLLCGLSTDEIARAFLVPEPTIAQRIVRAKKALAESEIQFEVPPGPELAGRLASVLEVIYLLFNEGYSATSGADWTRPDLCAEAVRLGRVLAAHLPKEAEVHGLVALMELQSSRLHARVDASGGPVLLLEQNRGLWDRLLIRLGLASLDAARLLVGDGGGGSYMLQAEIAACHARAGRAEETDWSRIASVYGELARVMPSPVVELNRAVAVSMAEGPEAGLKILEAVERAPSMRSYHLLPAVRGDLLAKLGRMEEARVEFERAASLTRNEREREVLLRRARNDSGG